MRTERVGVFDAVLFDMDGTLIDSTAGAEAVWVDWASAWPVTDPDFLAHIHGKPARDTLRRILPPALLEDALRDLQRRERDDVTGITPLRGAIDLLRAVPDARQAIVTSGFRDVALARLAAAGITPPRTMVTCESITRGKPHPEPFLLGADLLGVTADRTVAFEDTVAGVHSAKAAGCVVVAVTGTVSREALCDADHVVEALTEVRIASVLNGVEVRILTDPDC
ncbi:HAD-IA family hydrolase [Microbacterium sp. DT81.1]|uniref:HAD-IA family hydrolase n=1 Tax=Microbacterium sp. DT81.1 TaxID=3393413 RepID=UPI003CF5C080